MYHRQLEDDVRSIEREQALTRDGIPLERDQLEHTHGITLEEYNVETNPAPADD